MTALLFMVMSVGGKKYKRVDIDRIARKIYYYILNRNDFDFVGKDCKAFYRRLARWHLGENEASKLYDNGI